MKSYTIIYMCHFGYDESSWMPCERCNNTGVDIHHVYGRGKLLNEITNLICLCRNCHNLAHAEKITKEQLKEIHLNFMKNYETFA
jgi:5-methylcytosine-specific restriction endonuclease McrA